MNLLLPVVAIVTRTSRSAQFLERVLDGLEKQTGAKLVWVIVTQQNLTPAHVNCINRAKTFGIDVIVTYALKKDSLGRLANIGVNAVESSYIILHDDDDTFNQDFVGPALGMFAKKSCVAVACHAAFIEEKSHKHHLDFILSPGKQSVCLSELATDNLIVVHGLIYLRTAYIAIGGYNEEVSVAEDWIFNISLRKLGEISILDRVCANVFLRHQIDVSIVNSHTDKKKHLKMRDNIRMIEGSQNNAKLADRNNSVSHKIRRYLDRLIFSLSGKFLRR